MSVCPTCGSLLAGPAHADPALNNLLGRPNQFCDLLVLLRRIRAAAQEQARLP